MTPQEQQLLMQLTQKVNQTRLQEKDPDAENLLGRELGANPDAIYILAQTVLVQNIALEQARAQVAQLQQQATHPAHSSSFLGRLLGEREPSPAPAPQQQAYQPVPPQYAQPQYPPPYQQAQYAAAPIAAGQPSFLRGAMQTAAGVAAGALAFEGVESVLHGLGGFGHSGMGMGGFGMGPGMGMMGGFERPVDETVVNNYYGQPGGDRPFDSSGEPHFHDSTGESGAQFSGADYRTSGNDAAASSDFQQDNAVHSAGSDDTMDDASAAYDNSVDDVTIDDSGQNDGGFDDGGGFDNSGGDLL